MSNLNSKKKSLNGSLSINKNQNQTTLAKTLYLFMLLEAVTGCTIGTYISGHQGNIKEDYPDIRLVPSQENALKDRQNHQKAEALQRNSDLESLKQDLKSAQARDQQLRHQVVPEKK